MRQFGTEILPLRHAHSLRTNSLPRNALLAALFVLLLIMSTGSNPYAAHASTLQFHGALLRDDSVGIIAHRGAAGHAPENTLAAMRIAYDNDMDFVEADLQVTADGVAVLMHDDTVDRTTGGHGPVSSLTLEQVKALEAGGWYGQEFAGEPVPTLEEFLDDLTPTNSRALLELKGVWSDDDILEAVQMLRDRYLVNRIILSSFEIENIARLQDLAPEYARMLLTREWNQSVVDAAIDLQVSAVGARLKLFAAEPELVGAARQYGIGTMVYTLNKAKDWATASELGIDLIITDQPLDLEAWRDAQTPII